MPIQTLTLAQLQALAATTYSANAEQPANTDAGSTLGSIFNVDALMALNVQFQLIYVASLARLATITNFDDAVVFCAAFGVKPIGASPSSGLVTLTTASPVLAPFPIPVGGILNTDDGLLFTIIADLSNEFYDPDLNEYIIPTGESLANVTTQCQTDGIIGNVSVGQINTVYGQSGGPPISGIQTVSNAAAFTNGIDQESLQSLKQRFTLQMSTGVVATRNAILAAVEAVQAGLTVSVGDRVNADGTAHAAFFTVVLNELGQSSGPGSPLLSACSSAIEGVRALGISFACIGPTLIPVNGAATVVLQNPLPAGATSASVIAAVTAAYIAFLNNIGLDEGGASTRAALSQVYAALQAVPGVAYLDGLTLNSATADVIATFAHQIVAGTTNFTV